MICAVCKANIDNIDPISSDIFPVCVPCIDAKVIEIAEKKRGSSKQEIANQIWEVPPKEGLKAIYTTIRSFCRELVSGDLVPLDKQQVYDYYGLTKESVTKLADMWNGGHTWIDKAGYDEVMGV